MSVKFGPHGQCAHGLYNGCRACGEKPGQRRTVVGEKRKRRRTWWVVLCGPEIGPSRGYYGFFFSKADLRQWQKHNQYGMAVEVREVRPARRHK